MPVILRCDDMMSPFDCWRCQPAGNIKPRAGPGFFQIDRELTLQDGRNQGRYFRRNWQHVTCATAKLVSAGCGRVFAKLEWENPTGSMKDRMARAVIERAEADGRMKPGGTVIEYTGGSTGTSLALVCAAKGYRIRIVSSDAFSREKLDHMRRWAELILVPSEGGKTTRKLILDMIERARQLSREPNSFWVNQLNNVDTIAGYETLGEEIWQQTSGKVTAFVHSVGTGASSRGVATALKRHNRSIKLIAVEPAESAVLSGGDPGPHKIEGVGIGYIPPLYDASLVDQVIAIKTEDAKEMARRLREEALFAGTSSGANVLAAIEVAQAPGPGFHDRHPMCDSGLKYLSTDVFSAINDVTAPARRPAFFAESVTPHALQSPRFCAAIGKHEFCQRDGALRLLQSTPRRRRPGINSSARDVAAPDEDRDSTG